MSLPYKIATLLYCFSEAGEVLLLERAQEPNRGFWSPCGGKLKMDRGESPHACACREAHEEIGLELRPSDLHLTGLISEHGYEGQAHWLMFLFEVKTKLKSLPPPMAEGRFGFFPRETIASLTIPRPTVKKSGHGSGSFAAGSSQPTAIAIRTDGMSGPWKNLSKPPM